MALRAEPPVDEHSRIAYRNKQTLLCDKSPKWPLQKATHSTEWALSFWDQLDSLLPLDGDPTISDHDFALLELSVVVVDQLKAATPG